MSKFERCSDPADPNRCQSVHSTHGQCPFRAMQLPDGKYQNFCIRHGGTLERKSLVADSMDLYRAAQWHSKIKEKTDHPNIKSLRSEIGILRVILEERLNVAKDPAMLMMMSSTISELVDKIGRLVISCHKLDKDLGMMLDKSQALRLCSKFIEVIGMFIDDPDVLETISMLLIASVEEVASSGPEDLTK